MNHGKEITRSGGHGGSNAEVSGYQWQKLGELGAGWTMQLIVWPVVALRLFLTRLGTSGWVSHMDDVRLSRVLALYLALKLREALHYEPAPSRSCGRPARPSEHPSNKTYLHGLFHDDLEAALPDQTGDIVAPADPRLAAVFDPRPSVTLRRIRPDSLHLSVWNPHRELAVSYDIADDIAQELIHKLLDIEAKRLPLRCDCCDEPARGLL